MLPRAANAGGATVSDTLAVGDARRPRIGRAVLGTLLVAVVYEAFAFGVKEIPALGNHAPWADDPYDVATSLAIFFVPILAVVCAVRLPLCRETEPLPVSRVIDLLRGCRAILGVALVSVLADWISVGAGADRASWSPVTPVLIGLLALATILVVTMSVATLRVGWRDPPQDASATDGLADAIALAERASSHLGPFQRRASQLVRAVDRVLVSAIRRRPEVAAALVATAFAGAMAVSASLEEGIGPVLALFVAIGWCSMFAFLVIAGSYLGIVRRSGGLAGMRRRLVDAVVAGAASVPIVAAFRDSLWWIVGGTSEGAGLPRIGLLLVLAAAATFGVTLVVETLVRAHASPPSDGS